MTFKRGANKSDIKLINALLAEGRSCEEISKALFIEVSVVESFAPKKPKAKKPKTEE